MKALTLPLLSTVLALILTGCTEAPQGMKSAYKKSDGKPYEGADNAYVDKGWETGNRESWAKHLNQRSQAQNEYVRAN